MTFTKSEIASLERLCEAAANDDAPPSMLRDRALLHAACNALPKLLAEVKAQGWRTMDSAPKNKTPVLVWAKGWGCSILFWNGRTWDDGDFRSNETWPTHWMPLPAPPQEESK